MRKAVFASSSKSGLASQICFRLGLWFRARRPSSVRCTGRPHPDDSRRIGWRRSPTAWLRHQGQRSLGSAMGGRKEAGSGKSRRPCASTPADPPDHQLRGAADFRHRSAQHARRLDDLAIRRPRPSPIGRRSHAFFTSERPDRLRMRGRPRTDHTGAAPFEAVGITQSAHAGSLGFYLK